MHKEGYSMLSHFNPKACVCQNYCLYTSENELLANCVPEILQKITLQYPNGEVKCTKIAIEFNFQKDGVVSKVQHTLDIKELDKLKLVEVCSDLYTISDKKFISYIKLLIPKAPTVNKYFIESLGWTRINGHNVFCAGDRLIGNTDNVEYEVDPYLSNISISPNVSLSAGNTFTAIWNLLGKCDKKMRLTMIYILSAPLRQLFKDAGYIPKTVIYIEAKTQSGKTTFAQGLGCPFVSSNESYPNYTRVSSTQAFVEDAMSFFKDILYIYDDVYCDSDKRIRRAIEERVKGILRNFADNAPRNKKGATNQINSQLLLIGEELIDSVSNIGRLLVIRMDRKFTPDILTLICNNKNYINAFYTQYIAWVSNNYEDILTYISQSFKSFQAKYCKEISRDFDTEFFIGCIERLFCQYGRDKDFLTNDEYHVTVKGLSKDLSTILASNRDILNSAMQREQQRAALTKEINYSKLLYGLLQNKSIKVGEKGSKFFKNTCKGKKCYFIRREYFQSLILKYCRKPVSAKALTDYFRIRQIGIFDNNGRIRQYKKNRKRYLVLKISDLKEDAKRS